MAKITSLTEDSGIGMYYDKAMKKYDDGDFAGCLDLLFTARKLLNAPYSDDDLALTLEIADTYADMGLLGESNKYYFRLTPFNYDLDDIYYSLIRNFIFTGNMELALYYLNLGTEIGIFDSENGFSPEEIEALISPAQEKLHLVKEQDNEYLVQVARQLVNSHDTEFAKQMLSSIAPGSKNYADAANYLAIIEMSGGNIETGIEYCDSVLESYPDDVGALTAKIMGRNMQGERAEVEELTERLLELDISDMYSMNKVAMCMAEIGNSEYTVKFCEKMLRESPYEPHIMLIAALAHSNMGNRARAKELIVTLCSVFPENYTAKYYARLIDEADEKTDFTLNVSIDPAEKMRRIEAIDDALSKAVTPADFAEAYENDERLNEYVMWGLYEGGDAVAVKIGDVIARTPKGFALARQILLTPDCSVVLKKAVFMQLFKTGRIFRLFLVLNDKLVMFRPTMPKVTRRADFTDAYWQVYSALAFIETDFDRKLNTWYKKVVEALSGIADELNPNALAALIAYKSQINKIFALDSSCCEVFDCAHRDFMLYLKAMDGYDSNRRPARRRSAERKRPHIGRKESGNE